MTTPPWVVYCLISGPRSYVGVTKNLPRRLRQHNGALVGGARATRATTQAWAVLYVVHGFSAHRAALQLEWRLHRRWGGGGTPQSRRLKQLAAALTLERVTSTAPLTASLGVHIDWHLAVNTLGSLPPNITQTFISQT